MHVTKKPKFFPCLISKNCNYFRCLEVIFSLVCMNLAIMFYKRTNYIITTKILLLTVSTAFCFITSVDAISWCINRIRMQPKTWILIAIPAYCMFWLCAGFVLCIVSLRTWFNIIVFVLNLITGIIYLFDYMWIAKSMWDPSSRVAPASNLVDKAVSSCFLFEVNEFECPMMKSKKNRNVISVKPIRTSSMSHGGTFHVSKELAPLSSAGAKDCYCPKNKSASSSKSPDKRISEDRSHQSMSARSAGTSIKSNIMSIDEVGDEPYKLPSFKNKIEDKHIPYYLSSQPRMSLETLPEKDSRSSVESRKEFEIKHAEDAEYKAAKQQESIHTIKKITEENPQEKSGTTSRHHGRSEKHEENLLQPIDLHKAAVSFHSVAAPPEENPPQKSRESVISSLVKLFSRSKLKKDSARERKLSKLQEDSKENLSITMHENRTTYCAQAPATQDAVHHQYYQSPCCKCGRTHYQQQTTVSGSLARCCNPDCPASQNYDPPQRLNRTDSIRQNSIDSPPKLTKCTMANDVRNMSTDTACPPCRDAANQHLDGSRRVSYQSARIANAPASRENMSQQLNGPRRCPNSCSRSLQKRIDVKEQSVGSQDPAELRTVSARSQREEIYCGCNYRQRRNGLDDDYPIRSQYPAYSQQNIDNTTCSCCCECRDVGVETTPPERSSSLSDSLDRRENSASATPDSVDEEIMVSPSSETKEVSAVVKNNALPSGTCTCCACNDVRLYCAECCEPCHGQLSPEPMEFVALSRESKTTTSQISVPNNIKNCHAEPICSLCHMNKNTEDKSVNTAPKKKRFCFGKKRHNE